MRRSRLSRACALRWTHWRSVSDNYRLQGIITVWREIAMNAYSHLKRILKQQQLSIPELHRRIRNSGLQVNLKSLYRLSNENQPVERLDMRVAGAICRVCAVPLSAWIVFEEDDAK